MRIDICIMWQMREWRFKVLTLGSKLIINANCFKNSLSNFNEIFNNIGKNYHFSMDTVMQIQHIISNHKSLFILG